MRIFKRSRKHSFLFGVLAICFAACFWHGAINSDVFFMHLQGADLLAGNWDRSVDFLSCHDWLPFMHQKWAMCLLVHAIYSLFGVAGLNVAGVILFGMLGLTAYIVFEDLWPHGQYRNIAVPLMMMAALCNEMLISFRPHVISGIFMLVELDVLERWAQKRIRPACLVAVLSLMSFLTMWFHSTMWVLCLIPVMPYLFEFKLFSRISGTWLVAEPVKKGPLAISVAGMFFAACLNPAGLSEFEYIWLSLHGTDSDLFFWVKELQPVQYMMSVIPMASVCLLIMFAAASGVAIFRYRHVRPILFWLGSVFMAAFSMRMSFQAAILIAFAAVPALYTFLSKPDRDVLEYVGFRMACICCTVAFFVQCAAMQIQYRSDAWCHADVYFDCLEDVARFMVSDSGQSDPAFFSDAIDAGAYMELFGPRSHMDTRAELFVQPDSNGVSPADSLRQLSLGRDMDGNVLDGDGVAGFMRYYGLDYVVVRRGTHGDEPFYASLQECCDIVYSGSQHDVYSLRDEYR